MIRSPRLRLLVFALALAGAATALYVLRTDETPPRAPAGPDPGLELLTILGDVQDRPQAVPGRWRPARTAAPEAAGDDELSELTALPYLQGYKRAPEVTNVTVYDPQRAYAGISLYTSGHAPEAFVVDMEGRTLHRWRYAVEDVWPTVPETIHSRFWRRVYAYPDGRLLAIFEGIGLVKLDRDSRLLWAYRGGCHHEAFVTKEQNIYVLTRQAQIVPEINPDRPVLPDAITVLTPEGDPIDEYPLLECFQNSEYRGLLRDMPRRGDVFHTNSIHVFDGSLAAESPLFRRGNVLVSMLKLDVIAIIDLREREVVWARSGRAGGHWKRQHDPRPLPGGNLLLFDNQGRNGESRVLEFDPSDLRVVWQYPGEDGDLFSRTCGTSARLPNGNTLITESDNGRALEVTADGTVVWEFYNPHRAGENMELIATLFELSRLDTGYFPWLPVD